VASIDSMTFDSPSYAPGATITLVVDYTADNPSTLPVTFTATSTITDAQGAVTATSSAPFVVDTPQPAGDKVDTTDDGNRTWDETSDTGSVATFTTTA
jgi:hypothetical protein